MGHHEYLFSNSLHVTVQLNCAGMHAVLANDGSTTPGSITTSHLVVPV
jgi:hypothetical protein